MSGYWDAIGRAATGLQGSAQPRPRSLFEPDDALSNSDDFHPLEEDVEASSRAPTISPIRPAPLISGAAEQPQSREPAPSAPPPASPAHPVQPARAEVTRVEARPPTRGEAVATQEPRTPLPASPSLRAQERLEIRRIETTRIVSDTNSEDATIAPAPARPGVLVASPSLTAERPRSDEAAINAEPYGTEPSALAIAEPLAPAVTPTPPLAPRQAEPAPLVIEIGRIEIRIASEGARPPAAPPRRERPATLSLNDYLAGRSEAAR